MFQNPTTVNILHCVLYVLQKASLSFAGPVSQALRNPCKIGHFNVFATNIAVNCRLLSDAICFAKYFSLSHLMFFLSAINPNACRATGRGLQPKGVRVKEVADFKVFTKGAGSGSLSVSVKGPSELDSSYIFGFFF